MKKPELIIAAYGIKEIDDFCGNAGGQPIFYLDRESQESILSQTDDELIFPPDEIEEWSEARMPSHYDELVDIVLDCFEEEYLVVVLLQENEREEFLAHIKNRNTFKSGEIKITVPSFNPENFDKNDLFIFKEEKDGIWIMPYFQGGNNGIPDFSEDDNPAPFMDN